MSDLYPDLYDATKNYRTAMAGTREANQDHLAKHAQVAGGSMVDCCWWKVPPCPQILDDWGITTEKGSLLNTLELAGLNSDILVQAFFPVSILPASFKVPQETRAGVVGLDSLDCIDFATLPSDVPIIVFIPGGGFTLCENYSTGDQIIDLLSKTVKADSFIVLSIRYSSAPECPFPVPPIQCLSVLSYLMEKVSPERKIHISGFSAGANLAVVTAFEGHRRYPGRIGSLMVLAPMLDPAADSVSYREQTEPFLFVTPEWLRWCWRAYLQLNPQSQDLKMPDGSNRKLWDRNPWKGSSLERLVHPTVDLPLNLDQPEAFTSIVVTNANDPLHDDGVAFVNALEKAKAKVVFLDHPGLHAWGTLGSETAMDALAHEWRKLLYVS